MLLHKHFIRSDHCNFNTKYFYLKFEEKESHVILEEHTHYFCAEGLQRLAMLLLISILLDIIQRKCSPSLVQAWVYCVGQQW